jgi:hypothetical protein
MSFFHRLDELFGIDNAFSGTYWYTSEGGAIMILIQFPDRETEIKGLAILMSRFSGKVLRGGLHIVPEPALDVLTAEKIPYSVKGPATYEHEMAALRGDAAATIQ